MKLTKRKISKMAKEIMDFLKEKEISDGVYIFYNNKVLDENGICKLNPNPNDYFEYAAKDHILSMSFGIVLFSVFEGLSPSYKKQLDEIFNSYCVFYEFGDDWNLTCYPIYQDMEVEYTYYQKPNKPLRIYNIEQAMPIEIKKIAMEWRELQAKVGDVGSCVLGAGFSFNYNEREYFLSPCALYQGSISWEKDKDYIEVLLSNIGAKNIRYHWGRMD